MKQIEVLLCGTFQNFLFQIFLISGFLNHECGPNKYRGRAECAYLTVRMPTLYQVLCQVRKPKGDISPGLRCNLFLKKKCPCLPDRLKKVFLEEETLMETGQRRRMNLSRSRQVVAEKRMWCSKVRMPKDKYKNNKFFIQQILCMLCCLLP